MPNIWLLGGAALLLYSIYYLFTRKTTALPHFGGGGPINYLRTSLRVFQDLEHVLKEAFSQFGGKPFVLPTFDGPFIVVGPEYLERLRLSDDTVFNQPKEIERGLQLEHTMNSTQLAVPYHIDVVRTDLTRGIGAFVPEILEESQMAIDEVLKGSHSTSIPLFHDLTHLVARISSRAMVGLPLCRDEGYINAIVKFAETLVPYSMLLAKLPALLRPAVYRILSTYFGGPKEPMKYLVPYVKDRLSEKNMGEDDPHLISTFLINSAPPEEAQSPEALSMRILNLNFGSIHTTSIFGSHSLFEIARLPKSDVELIREEINSAVQAEGGFNKAALAKFRRIDSILREVGRLYGLGHFGLGRLIVKETSIDGIQVPPGYTITIDASQLHRNPAVYSDPNTFQAFRFLQMREKAGSDVKYGFTTVDNDFIPFAVGRHACPGRFFAAMELKIIIAHIVLNYDLSYADGATEKPKNMAIGASIMPNPTAHLVFTKRKTTSSA